MPIHRTRRSLLLSAGLILLTFVLTAGLFYVHLECTLTRSAVEVRRAGELDYTLAPLRMPANPGFVPVLSSANLRAVSVLGDRTFLSSAVALFEFKDGVLIRTFQAGIDLPSFPLGSLATGRLHNATGVQMFVMTAGAGLLVLDPESDGLTQLLPADHNLRDITALTALPEGDLLLGTRRGGVLRFNGETLRYERPELRGKAVTCLLATDESVWIGTQEEGLFVSRAGILKHLRAELPDLHVEALSSHGTDVFAATATGVVQFQNGEFVRNVAPGVFAHALVSDEHELTLATIDGDDLTVPLGDVHEPIAIAAPSSQPSSSEARIQQFLQRPDGLYAVRGHSLVLRDRGIWSPALSVPSAILADNNIAALRFASDGRLWVGYFDHGVDVLSPTLGDARHLEDDHLFCVNRIAEDPNRGTMAVATANGLVLFDRTGTPRQVLGTHDGLISEHVTDLAWTTNGRDATLAIATPAGLTFLSRDGAESLYAFQGLVNNHVYSVAADADGQLLAGTLGGASLLQHTAIRTNFTVTNSPLRHNWISAVLPMPAFAGGGFLLGTYGGGLMQLTADLRIASLPGAPRTAVINPNALLATPDHLFAGTLGDGLWTYGRVSGRWQQITAGLPSRSVTALAAQHGDLFVGTDNGLMHIPEGRLPE